MIDALPFLHLTAKDTNTQIEQITEYLFHLKEALELILMNISTDNLSAELRDKLNKYSKEIEGLIERDVELAQQMVENAITVEDVLESEEYKESLKEFLKSDEYKEAVNESEAKFKPKMMDAIIEEMKANLESGELEYKEEVE